jgi:hypothetical protein
MGLCASIEEFDFEYMKPKNPRRKVGTSDAKADDEGGTELKDINDRVLVQ